MIDHVSIGVRNLGKARCFFDALFRPLGYEVISSTAAEVSYGPPDEGAYFFLYLVQGDQIAGLGTHVAFSAKSVAAVDASYSAALDQGAVSVRTAGRHPDISATYYGAILLDPDENRLEIVHNDVALSNG